MKQLKTMVWAAAVCVAALGNARAASITYDYTNFEAAANSFNYSFQTTNWTATLLLPKFDDSLGTLTGATLTLTGETRAIGKIDNESPTGGMFTLNTSAEMNFISGDFGLPYQSLTVGGIVWRGYLGPDDEAGSPDFTGSDASGELVDVRQKTLVIASGGLDRFRGATPSTLGVNVDATGWMSSSGGGNMVVAVSTAARANISVTYTYDPATSQVSAPLGVPEPGSLPLALLALVGAHLGRSRWREARRSRAGR